MIQISFGTNDSCCLFGNNPLQFSRAFPTCLLGAHVGTIDIAKTM